MIEVVRAGKLSEAECYAILKHRASSAELAGLERQYLDLSGIQTRHKNRCVRVLEPTSSDSAFSSVLGDDELTSVSSVVVLASEESDDIRHAIRVN